MSLETTYSHSQITKGTIPLQPEMEIQLAPG